MNKNTYINTHHHDLLKFGFALTGDGQRTWDVRLYVQTKNERRRRKNYIYIFFIHFFHFFPLVSKCLILMISLTRFVFFALT